MQLQLKHIHHLVTSWLKIQPCLFAAFVYRNPPELLRLLWERCYLKICLPAAPCC